VLPVWQVQRPWEEASHGRYFRGLYVHDLSGAYAFEFAVCDEGGASLALSPPPVVQFVLDGVDVGAPVTGNISRLTLDLGVYPWDPDTLQHVLWGRVVGPPVHGGLAMLGVCFTTGEPAPLTQPGWCWICATKYDVAYSIFTSYQPVRVWYPGHQINPPPARFVPPRALRPEELVFPPEDRLLPPRERRPIASPYSTLLPHSQFWMTGLGTVSRGLTRRFGVVESATHPGIPRVAVTAKEQYAYFDGVQNLATARGAKDYVPLVDGPLGSGQLGHGWSGWVARHEDAAKSGGVFITCTNSRLVYAHRWSGRLTTVAGRRLRTAEDFTLSPATSRVDGLLSSAFTSGAVREGQMEWHADWQDAVHDFSEPWGAVPLGPYPTPAGDIHHELHGVIDTLNDRIAYVDHRPCHEAPGRKPTVRTFTRFPAGSQPWDGVRIHGTDDIWIPEFMGHALVHVDARTGAIVERVETAGPKPTLADIGVAARGEMKPTIPRATLVSRYVKDGPVGTASFIFPQALRHDSHGNLFFACRYTHTIHKLDLTTRVISLVATLRDWTTQDARDIALDINWDGTCGPLDCMRITQWGQNTDGIYSATGGWLGTIFPRLDMYRHLVTEGPLDWLVTCNYPTMVASGMGRVYLVGTGSNQLWMQTRRLATDPTLDAGRYGRGIAAWKAGHGGPSFALSNGEEGQGNLGLPTWDDLALLSDADLAAAIRGGAGTGIPRSMSDLTMGDLIYVIRWHAVTNPPTGGSGTDVTPPARPSTPWLITPFSWTGD